MPLELESSVVESPSRRDLLGVALPLFVATFFYPARIAEAYDYCPYNPLSVLKSKPLGDQYQVRLTIRGEFCLDQHSKLIQQDARRLFLSGLSRALEKGNYTVSTFEVRTQTDTDGRPTIVYESWLSAASSSQSVKNVSVSSVDNPPFPKKPLSFKSGHLGFDDSLLAW